MTVIASTRHKLKRGQRGKRKTIEQIRANIQTYERRRAEFKEKYSYIFATPVNRRSAQDQKNVIITLSNISAKLLILNKSLVLHLRKYKKIEAFNKIFTEYSGKDISVWCFERISRKKGNINKLIIYKYLLEEGVDSGAIREYFNRKFCSQIPARHRQAFTKSFKTNPAHYDAWQKFKSYMNANKYKI